MPSLFMKKWASSVPARIRSFMGEDEQTDFVMTKKLGSPARTKTIAGLGRWFLALLFTWEDEE